MNVFLLPVLNSLIKDLNTKVTLRVYNIIILIGDRLIVIETVYFSFLETQPVLTNEV